MIIARKTSHEQQQRPELSMVTLNWQASEKAKYTNTTKVVRMDWTVGAEW